jgi:hypothetical protein
VGVGALIRRNEDIYFPEPLIHGGAQERGHFEGIVFPPARLPLGQSAASHVLATTEISPALARGAVRVSWIGAPERPMSNAFLPLGEGLQMHCLEGTVSSPKWLHWRTFSRPFEWFKRPT